MSVAESARVLVFVADYAGVDAGGKINAVGAGFTMTPTLPQAGGATPAQYVVAAIDVDPRHVGEEFALTIELRQDSTNSPVQVPGPTGPEALRISQMVRADRPSIGPEYQLPPDLYGRVQVALAFPTGLQLSPGTYRWQILIDNNAKPDWCAVFHVLAPRTGPVVGGPSNPVSPDLPRP